MPLPDHKEAIPYILWNSISTTVTSNMKTRCDTDRNHESTSRDKVWIKVREHHTLSSINSAADVDTVKMQLAVFTF